MSQYFRLFQQMRQNEPEPELRAADRMCFIKSTGLSSHRAIAGLGQAKPHSETLRDVYATRQDK